MFFTFIKKYYQWLLIVALSVGCYLGWTRTVEPVVKTQTVTQVVEKEIIKEVYIKQDKKATTTTVKPDGTKIVKVEEVTRNTVQTEHEAVKMEQKTAITYAEKYKYGLGLSYGTDQKITITGMMRLGDTPFYGQTSISGPYRPESWQGPSSITVQAGIIYQF